MTFTHIEGETLKLFGAPSAAGRVLLRADVSAATLSIYALDDPDTVLFTKTLYLVTDPSSSDYDQAMFAALQTDDNWPHADGGYSFFAQVTPAEYALVGGSAYRAVATLTAGTAAAVWPDMSDLGAVVVEWPFVVDATP